MANPCLKASNKQPSKQRSEKTISWQKFEEELKAKAEHKELPPPPVPLAEEILKRALSAVKLKKLRSGYASYLSKQASFCTWLLIVQEDARVWP